MKTLNKTYTYLSGGMQYTQDGKSWREKCAEELEKMGVLVFDPYKKPFENSREETPEVHKQLIDWMDAGNLGMVAKHMKEVVADDLAMVDRSDFIVAYINKDIPTYGTTHELVVAVQQKKPIFVFVEGGVKNTPLWLLGIIPPHYFYDNLEDLLETLKQINEGSLEIDSSRWRLFKKEYR